jgi:glycosyltransferase involved in cell wall biosynthesis
MNLADPSVSVVIPVHNGANYVAEAIQSCVAQTRAVQQIIVVDDGSTDATADVVTRFGNRVIFVRQQWAGCGAALNHGIAVSSGEMLAFLDHDDLWMPDKNRIQLQEFQERPMLEAAFGLVEQFITPELESSLKDKVRIPDEPQPAVQTSAMLVRREGLQRIGPFDERKDALAMQSWYACALRKSLRISMMPVIVSRRRIHKSNFSRLQRAELYQRYLELTREMANHNRRARSVPRNDK